MNIPILITVFNRPDLLIKVLDQVQKIKPQKLYIACDGPRNEADLVKIEEIKLVISSKVNWDVEIFELYSEQNLQTYRALPKAISWFFEHEEMGIILEDDCVPDISFFNFCSVLLEKYKDDERVFSISANNFQDGQVYGDGSYFFSKYFHVWGWASWRRAWQFYDENIVDYPTFKKQERIKSVISDKKAQKRIIQLLDRAYKKKPIWDYKWQFAHLYHDKYTIKPQVNLVTNVGFDERATNVDNNPLLSDLKVGNVGEIKFPTYDVPYFKEADDYIATTILQPPSFWELVGKGLLKARYKIKKYKLIT